MARISKVIAGALVALALSANTASAMLCGQRDIVIAELKDRFQEERQGLGTTSNGDFLVELYASPNGTFSVVITYPTKLSCVIIAGAGWQGIKPLKGVKNV